MIDRTHDLALCRQAQLVGISRGTAYHVAQPVSQADCGLMRRIDELHLKHPFAGSRMLRDMLNREGFDVGRKHVATLMARMGIEALYRKPNTSKKHPAHKVYPYLLRGLTVERANHVWAGDQTGSMSGQHKLSTASLVRRKRRPPPWTTLHLCVIGRVPLIKPISVFNGVGPPLSACSAARANGC